MLDKMSFTTGPCRMCGKTVKMDEAGIIARHECLGTWHIQSPPFNRKVDAQHFATSTFPKDKCRVIPRRSRWIVQVWRATTSLEPAG